MKHPGFQKVQQAMARAMMKKNKGMSMEQAMEHAGAALASRSRGASASAKKHNPRLKRVKG